MIVKTIKMRIPWTVTIPIVVLILQELHFGQADDVITSDLNHFLFDNYQPQLLPLCRAGDTLKVRLNIALRQIFSLNEKGQVLTTNAWVRLGWYDCRLAWTDQKQFQHIERLVVPYKRVWTPDLELYDSVTEDSLMAGQTNYRVQLNSSGYVQYNFPSVLRSMCQVSVTYFPFDTQTCILPFGSWSYSVADLDMVIDSTHADMDQYVENSEWKIDELPGKRCEKVYVIGNYSDVRFKFVMKRRPDFYVMTMLFPCILTCAIATIGFLLPPESGEKVSLEVTVLLSLAVFLLVISDLLPPSSESFPIIGSYFAGSMTMVSLSLIMAVIVLHVHYKGEAGQRIPNWARRLFLRKDSGKYRNHPTGGESAYHNGASASNPKKHTIFLTSFSRHENVNSIGTFSHRERSRRCSNPDDQSQSRISTTPPPALSQTPNPALIRSVQEMTEYTKVIRDNSEDLQIHTDICGEWKTLARVLDVIFLSLYMLTSLVVSAVFLIQFVWQTDQDSNIDVCEFGNT